MPGTRLLFGGFFKVRFSLNDAVGRSVMYARAGKMLGGNSAFAHIGTYEEDGDEIAIEIKTVRHNPDPNYRAMAGTDDATLLARGRADGVAELKSRLVEAFKHQPSPALRAPRRTLSRFRRRWTSFPPGGPRVLPQRLSSE